LTIHLSLRPDHGREVYGSAARAGGHHMNIVPSQPAFFGTFCLTKNRNMQPNKKAVSGYRLIALSAFFFLSLACLSFQVKLFLDDFWQQLGISQRDGTNYIKSSFATGYLQFGLRPNFKNIPVGDRKAVSTDLLIYAKTIAQSNEFKTEYERARQSRKPRREPQKPKTEAQVREEKIKNVQSSIDNTETVLKTTTDKDTKKSLEESLDYFKKELVELQKPGNALVVSEVQGQQKLYENLMKKYNENIKQWNEEFPENVTDLLKQRLQKMLSETANVDYGAALTERNGKKYFVNPAYEAKPVNWKFAYRAGKEVTETTRAFAQQWLQELNKQ
jgi:hypothetical protein